MRKNTRNNSRIKKKQFCALLDKPCLGEGCALHYGMFGKCSLELIAYNMHPMTVATQELTEINHDLLGVCSELSAKLNKSKEQQKLF